MTTMRRQRPGEKIAEGEDGVYIEDGDTEPRIVAYNEGGHNCTEVFVTEVLDWVRKNRPDLLAPPSSSKEDEVDEP